MPAVLCPHAAMLILFHPDYTVGSGITPDLLTPPARQLGKALAGSGRNPYRRWGLSPRPENSIVGKTKRCMRQAANEKGSGNAEPLEILLSRSRLRPADDQISR